LQPAIAAIVRLLRLKKGWSQERLARTVGVEPSEISHLESGRRNPTLGTLDKLADGFGVRCSEMVDLAEELEFKVQQLRQRLPRS